MGEVLAVLAIGLLWSFLAGELTLSNMVVGIALGLGLLMLVQGVGERTLPWRIRGVLRFFVRFLGELVKAGVTIALLTVRRRPRFHPHIIAVPLRVESDAAITLLAATITLLPGTVAMGVSSDRQLLYAHAIGEPNLARAHDSVMRIETLILGFMR